MLRIIFTCLLTSTILYPFHLLQAGEETPTIPDLRTRTIGSDWPAFLGPSGNGKSPEKGVISPWQAEGPTQIWQVEAGQGFSAPAIARGRLFLFDRKGEIARLRCLNSETGKEIWRFEYPTDYKDLYGIDDGPRAAPVVDQDRVYILGVQGRLYCLNILDGAVRWKIDTQNQFSVVQNFFGVGSTPVIEGDLLITAIGGSKATVYPNVLSANGRLESNGSAIVAFNKFNGEVVYQTGQELASYTSPVIATISGQRQGFYFARGGLLSFDPQNGRGLFHFPWRARKLESVNAANPVFQDNLVFISEAYELGSSVLKLTESGYEVLWQDQKRSRSRSLELHWNTAIFHQGYLYACHGQRGSGAQLRCIELATGVVQWSYPLKELASLLFVEDHFIALGERGTLLLFKANPRQAEIMFEQKLRDAAGEALLNYPAWAAPVLSQGYLYLRSKEKLVCLDLVADVENGNRR